MKTQLKTEVKGIAIELSIAEALAFLKDPERVQDEVKSMLNGGGVEMPEGSSYGREYPMIECPDCGKSMKKKGLKIHQTRFCRKERIGTSLLDSQVDN